MITSWKLSTQISTEEAKHSCFRNSFIKISTQHLSQLGNTSISILTAIKMGEKERNYFAERENGAYSSDILQNLLFSL